MNCPAHAVRMSSFAKITPQQTQNCRSHFLYHMAICYCFRFGASGNSGSLLLSFRSSLVKWSLRGSFVTESGFASSCTESEADAASILLSTSASRVPRTTQGAIGCFQSSRRSGMMKMSSQRGITKPRIHQISRKCPMMKPMTWRGSLLRPSKVG